MKERGLKESASVRFIPAREGGDKLNAEGKSRGEQRIREGETRMAATF